MAINLDINTAQGSQFAAFVQLAETISEDAVVRVKEGEIKRPDGEPRIITAKGSDGRGYIWRGADSKSINQEARNLFLKTVLDICGVANENQLPAGVKAAMKLQDYDGKGHPLTAHRIRSVNTAILAAKEEEEAAKQDDFPDPELEDDESEFGDDNATRDKLSSVAPKQGNADTAQAILDKVNQYRETYGDAMADLVLGTVKSMEEPISPDDLMILDEQEMEQLDIHAASLDTSEIASFMFKAQEYVESLNRFRQDAVNTVKKLYPDGAGKPVMAEIKKNILMEQAIVKLKARSKFQVASMIKHYYEDLVGDPAQKDIMNVIVPELDRNAKIKIRG